MAMTMRSCAVLAGTALALASWTGVASAQETAMDLSALMDAGGDKGGNKDKKKPDFPPFDEVSDGFEKVANNGDGNGFYTLWVKKKNGQMLAELPSGFSGQKQFFAMTVPTGELFAGLQAGDLYCYWKRFDKRLALIAPNVSVKSSGDQESKDSIKRHFTDRVILDVPIVCMGPGGQPVIDMDDLLLGKASQLYGFYGSGMKRNLATIEKAKSFPDNIEVAFEVPTSGGTLQTFYYSISKIEGSPGYKPRVSDERLGYFTTAHRDLGKFSREDVWQRYITRWHLEKAEKNLSMSPPKEPIEFYIEHTVPVRYRRWVKEGIEYWNEAFEDIGITDAIVVHYQDKSTGTNMDKDPEDVRYNFIRWLSNDIGTAIGPSRAHPETGEILDADVVLTDGWIRAFYYQANEFLPGFALEGFAKEDLDWLEEHPQWDPRVRLASPSERQAILAERAVKRARRLAGDGDQHEPISIYAVEGVQELAQSIGSEAALCLASQGKAWDMTLAGLTFNMMGMLEEGEDDDTDRIDGIPEWFVGPMLADLVAHEVGHTLGLRHNFKASSLYSLGEMNSPDFKGKTPFTGSVMDYNPVNVNMDEGPVQGDFAMIHIGPYDRWVIAYGYTLDDPEEVLSRVSEENHAYATDWDTTGPDPLARRYDFAADPLEFAQNRMKIANWHRERILDEFVEDGDSWGRARRGYDITLGTQTSAVSMMANWIGGAFINKDKKGDPGARKPIEVVPAETQRKALDFVIANSFNDDAFGLTHELLEHMTIEKHTYGGQGSPYDDATWPVHDRVSGVQASALSMIMRPTTLRRVYDNEFLVPEDEDAFTLAEMMNTVTQAIWTETKRGSSGTFTTRKPMVSSLRRALQREHLERLIDLSMGDAYGTAGKTIANLAVAHLEEIRKNLNATMQGGSKVDPYTAAHFEEARTRIRKALDAQYIYNTDDMGGGGGGLIIMLGDEDAK